MYSAKSARLWHKWRSNTLAETYLGSDSGCVTASEYLSETTGGTVVALCMECPFEDGCIYDELANRLLDGDGDSIPINN